MIDYSPSNEYDDTTPAERAEADAFDAWADTFDDAEADADEYHVPTCPHCDAPLHGPTSWCWCAGCDACDRARGIDRTPDPDAPCSLCDGTGRYFDHGYVATEAGTRPPVEGPCPACTPVPVS